MVKLTPLVGLISVISANVVRNETPLIDTTAVKHLRSIESYERLNGPLSFQEVLQMAADQGFDLASLLESRGITEDDIERQKENAHLNGEDLNGDGFIDIYEEERAAESENELDILFPGNNFMLMQKSQKYNNLSDTTPSIFALIFGPQATSPPRTKPMFEFTTTEELPQAYWDSWKEWASCSKSCGGGFQTRYRSCKNSAYGDCKGLPRQMKECNKHDCAGSEWSSWNAWTACSRSCNSGMQIRSRTCQKVGGAPCVAINGVSNMEMNKCNTNSCYTTNSQWTPWGNWSNCGKSCDGGYRIRKRVCLRDSGAPNCPGTNVDSEKCNTEPCARDTPKPIGDWTTWSECSVSCGVGQKTRTRTCSYNPGRCRRYTLEDKQQCFSGKPCGEWASWGSWGTCSVSCNLGIRTRTRKCIGGVPGVGGCVGNYEDQDGCNAQACPEWNSWSDWSGCSQTCGGGLSRRSRYCRNGIGCPGDKYDEKVCQTDRCPVWKNWSQWTACDQECGGGWKERERTCEDGNPGQRGCFGDYKVKARCNTRDCPAWESWAAWSECSASCGVGRNHRYRYCNHEGECDGDDTESNQCFAGACASWENWGSWSECTVTCGRGGNQKRYRECSGKGECQPDPYTQDTDSQFQQCQAASICPSWMNWSAWNSCSVTCGGGTSSRSRECNLRGECQGISTSRTECNAQACPTPAPSFWKSWSSWSSCSVSCGGGLKHRSRTCSGNSCSGDSRDSETCNDQACPVPSVWRSWSSWSSCSQSCGGGEKTRSRSCTGNSCNGNSRDSETCNDQACPVPSVWRSWSSWSSCSQSCGGGEKTRSRSCTGPSCFGSAQDSDSCNTFECAAMEPWGNWASCNCSTQKRKRTRHCSRPDPRSVCPEEFEQFENCACTTKATPMFSTEAATTQTTTDETLGDIADDINEDNESGECVLLNVNGDCLDHLKYDKGDKIVDINSCDLPAYIIRNQEVIGMAEIVKGTENRVKYSCVENYKLRGNRIVECRCRGNRCRTKPKNLPVCAPAVIHVETSPPTASTTPLSTRSQTNNARQWQKRKVGK